MHKREEREKRKERAVCEFEEGSVVTTVTVVQSHRSTYPSQAAACRRNAAQIKRNSTHQQFANYHGLVDTTSQIL